MSKYQYKDKYNIWDIVEVWKYALHPWNEKTNELECISMIIATRKKETISLEEYKELERKWELDKIKKFEELEYLVWGQEGKSTLVNMSWKSNYQLLPINKK